MPKRPRQKKQAENGLTAPDADIADAVATDATDTTVPVGWVSSEPIVVGRPTPVFEPKANDPIHRQFPYRPDTALDGWSTSAFTVRAASSRGHFHRYEGAPRQDDFAIAIGPRPDQLIVAIADGVSAAPQSHIGASTVVRYAVQWLHAALADETAEVNWQALAESTAWALIEQAAAVAGSDQKDAEEAERLAATTLVCAVVERNDAGGATAELIGIGDSGAWVLGAEGFEKIEGGKDVGEGGVSSSAVSGLPRVPTAVAPRTATVQPGEVLLLGTDGFGDPLGRGDGEVGGLFRSVLLGRVPSLIEFAHALDFSRETFDDDRTLVALWPLPAPDDPDA